MFKKLYAELNHNKRKMFLFFVVLLVLFVICSRIYDAVVLRKQTLINALPVVTTLTVKKGSGVDEIVLPGNVLAWHEATIYARTNGYIKKWYVDIGSHVKKGELLAEIETPELDAQLRQAEADLNTAIANNQLAQSTAKRWINLLKSDSVSKQETDEKISSAAALNAVVIASRANLERLKQLVSFERVIAPFDGTITSRTTDIGSLINAGSSTDGVALFKIAQTDLLRVYVKIPQNYSTRITRDMTVNLRFTEHPGKLFPATLVETAQAIDPLTRTLLAQFKVNNKDNQLLAGSYAEVLFSFPVSPLTVRLPVNTLLFRSEGLQVATVDSNQCVVLKPITVTRDFGTEVEVRSGINPGDQVIVNPSDSILNGEKVRIAS